MQNKHLSYTWNTHNKHFIIASQGIFPSVHSSLEVLSLDKQHGMKGKQITAGQLTNRECITMHVHDMMITMRFTWALQHDT